MAEELDMRRALGLTAAGNGDVAGVARFVRFVQAEFSSMAMFTDLPMPVADYCKRLAWELDRADSFFTGFQSWRDDSDATS